ncbi:MAG: C4-type zinc ribbon domain-containing protein [Thermoanaerobaculia bacterium]
MTDMISQLVHLSRSMKDLASASALLAGVPDSMRALHDEFTAAKAALDALDASATQAELERRQAEAAIADAQEKLKHFQQQISKVRNQREYGALLTEIDGVKQQTKTLDDAALAAFSRVEELQAEAALRRTGFADLESRYQAEMVKWEAEKPEVAKRAAVLKAEVDGLEVGLPRPILGHLRRIFERYKGETLATVRKVERPGAQAIWHCSSCNYQIRPQVAVEIRSRGTIVQCEGCKRFLRVDDNA